MVSADREARYTPDVTADEIVAKLRQQLTLVERDRSRRIEFEVKSRNEYFDLAPIRAQYRRVKAKA